MTFEDVSEYLIPALAGLGMESEVGSAEKLDNLLGIDAYSSVFRLFKKKKPLTPELQNLYRALAGPHAHTVLKMWRIKKGLEHATEEQANCAD